MIEYLISSAVSHPGFLKFWGNAAVSITTVLAFLVLRLDRRIALIERRPHVEVTLDQMLPWWLRWAVPESVSGWLGIALLFATGAYLLATGKRIEEFLT